MDNFYIRPISEADINNIITSAGGTRAHADADKRDKPGADYLLNSAVIELKALDDEGLEKPERQSKLASLFSPDSGSRPVVVLDRSSLPISSQREYDRILAGPIKRAVQKAAVQLKQSRLEHTNTDTSILFILNNGYTALEHEELVELVTNRVSNDTREIDGVIVAGCYYYSDSFDNYFVWPMTYLPINVSRPFRSYDKLKASWDNFAGAYMTKLINAHSSLNAVKGPVVDVQFDIDNVTYVKPTPPIGRRSDFFRNGRPRKDSTGMKHCPPVGRSFPDMTKDQWFLFHKELRGEPALFNSYEDWKQRRSFALCTGTALQPVVPVSVTFDAWRNWCANSSTGLTYSSVALFANELFDQRIRSIYKSARERVASAILPSTYILCITEEIGQDKANDVSHIHAVREMPLAVPSCRELVVNVRIFHYHALALACAHAVAEKIDCVLWEKDRRYAWE